MHYTLIGMSGAGKSFLGRQLAQKLSYDFFDVDTAMEARYGKTLSNILEELGDEGFLNVIKRRHDKARGQLFTAKFKKHISHW